MKYLKVLLPFLAFVNASCGSCQHSTSSSTDSTADSLQASDSRNYDSDVNDSPSDTTSDVSSCTESNCSVSDASSLPDMVKKPEAFTVSGDTWEITLQPEWSRIRASTPEVMVEAVSNEHKVVLFFLKEKFSGTQDKYVIFALGGLRDSGATLMSAKSVVVNGIGFVLVEAARGKTKTWNWITTKNGFGYGFSCGGSEILAVLDEQFAACHEAASSLKLK